MPSGNSLFYQINLPDGIPFAAIKMTIKVNSLSIYSLQGLRLKHPGWFYWKLSPNAIEIYCSEHLPIGAHQIDFNSIVLERH